MDNKKPLLELAERCEAATEGSLDLDNAIRDAAGEPREPGSSPTPYYTASVDAALTLVPEGWRVGFEDNASCDDPGKVYAWVWPFESRYDPDWQMGQEGQQSNPDALKGYAATRALAICAAALRARVAQ